MNKNELIRTVREMIAASSCCAELKAAGEKWLAAVGTAEEHAAGAALLAEAREDVSTIDHTVEFFESPVAVKIFGAEKAKAMAGMPAKSALPAPSGATVPPAPRA